LTPHNGTLLGATIAGKYRIEREIGRGAMGVVCEARHVDLGKRIAIKLIESSLSQEGEVAGRFRREARVTGLIDSENVVQVFDAGVDERVGLYMVMELLRGEDLCTRLEREGHLDVETSVRIAVQIARALQKAHDAGVVHRDLKPANVFLVAREDGAPFVKILDFGISKLLGKDLLARSGGQKLTRAGTAVGTPQYASPEQAQGFDTVDHRTDVWSLGVLLYEMLSGKMAYPEMPTYEQFIIQLVTSSPEPLTKVAPWVPREVARVVDRALRHHLDERIPSCELFAKMLLQAVPSAATPTESGHMRAGTKRADDTVQMDPNEAPRPSLVDLLAPDSSADAPWSGDDSKTRVDASLRFDDDGKRISSAPPPSMPRFSDVPNVPRAAHVPQAAPNALARPNVAIGRPASESTVSRRVPPPSSSTTWIYVAVGIAVVCVAAVALVLLR
jgi:serine/threonine-protein kinase